MNRERAAVREVSPAEARELALDGALLLDVRDPAELLAGTAQGAVHVPRCDLDARITELAPDRHRTLLLLCASGRRSLLAAAQLAALGFQDARSVSGGLERWRREGMRLGLGPGSLNGEAARLGRALVVNDALHDPRFRAHASLAATTGVHTAADVLKLVMAGADVAMSASALLKQGPGWLGKVRGEMVAWMEEHEYDSIEQMKGSMSQKSVADPAAFERANYMKVLAAYQMQIH